MIKSIAQGYSSTIRIPEREEESRPAASSRRLVETVALLLQGIPSIREAEEGLSEDAQFRHHAPKTTMQTSEGTGVLTTEGLQASAELPSTVPLTVDADTRPYLVSDMAKLRDGLLSLILTHISMAGVSAREIRISLKRSPEEDWQEVVFRVFVDANAAQALAFWDSIGRAIMRWRPRLSRRAQRLLDEQIGVFVEWV